MTAKIFSFSSSSCEFCLAPFRLFEFFCQIVVEFWHVFIILTVYRRLIITVQILDVVGRASKSSAKAFLISFSLWLKCLVHTARRFTKIEVGKHQKWITAGIIYLKLVISESRFFTPLMSFMKSRLGEGVGHTAAGPGLWQYFVHVGVLIFVTTAVVKGIIHSFQMKVYVSMPVMEGVGWITLPCNELEEGNYIPTPRSEQRAYAITPWVGGMDWLFRMSRVSHHFYRSEWAVINPGCSIDLYLCLHSRV